MVEGLGRRTATLRKSRGLTQQQLADRAHFSVSMVSKVEQGVEAGSAAFVAGIARVLGVRPVDLYGALESEVITEPGTDDLALPELRTALDCFDDPRPIGPPLDLAGAERAVTALRRTIKATRYSAATVELPGLLHHLYVLADRPGDAGARACGLLHDTYRMTAYVAGRYRQSDVAAVASERHRHIAAATADPVRVALSTYARATPHLQLGSYSAGLRLLHRALSECDESPAGHALAVQIQLRAAIMAVRNADVGEADEHIAAARARTAQYRPPVAPYFGIDNDPQNIDIHWCAIPVENNNGAEAIRRGNSVTIDDTSRPERIAHHHVDQARAWLLQGDREQVLGHLRTARKIAPHNTRHHPQVAETLRTLAERDRRSTDSLAEFARWLGTDTFR